MRGHPSWRMIPPSIPFYGRAKYIAIAMMALGSARATFRNCRFTLPPRLGALQLILENIYVVSWRAYDFSHPPPEVP